MAAAASSASPPLEPRGNKRSRRDTQSGSVNPFASNPFASLSDDGEADARTQAQHAHSAPAGPPSIFEGRLKGAIALRAALIKRDKLKGAIAKLTEHKNAGTAPRSLTVKDQISASLGADAPAEIAAEIKTAMKQYEQANVAIVLKVRQDQLTKIEQHISTFIEQERKAASSIFAPVGDGDQLYSSIFSSVAPVSGSTLEQHMSAFTARCKQIWDAHAAQQTADSAAAKTDHAQAMQIDEAVNGNAAASIQEIVNRTVAKELKAMRQEFGMKKRDPPQQPKPAPKPQPRPTPRSNTPERKAQPKDRESRPRERSVTFEETDSTKQKQGASRPASPRERSNTQRSHSPRRPAAAAAAASQGPRRPSRPATSDSTKKRLPDSDGRRSGNSKH